MLNFKPKNNPWRWLIILLLAFGIFFRCFNIEQKPYWGDESLTSQRIAGYINKDFPEIVSPNDAMTVDEIQQQYQRPNSSRDLKDVMRALADHAEHPPLYYLMARFWMQLFQDVVPTPRTLSVLISFVAIPCVYFLCWELFKSSLVGWVAMGLLAVAPVQVIYAQEARQYSLWTVTILLSSWALLRALRINSKRSWGVYILTLSLGLYTHLISVIIAAAHGLYVFFHESCRLSKRLFAYLLASLAGCLLFTPWIIVTIFEKIGGSVEPAWVDKATPLASLLQAWLLNLSRVFIDFNEDFVYANLWIYAPILVFVLYAIYFLCKNTQTRVWLFVVLLIAVPALFLILPDLILGGRRSTQLRYFMPSSLGVQIAVAYLLSSKVNFSIRFKYWSDRLWRIITVVIVSSGVLSGILICQADTWWFKYEAYYQNEVAKIINSKEQPLVIADWYDMRTLSHALDSHVVLQDIRPLEEFNSIDHEPSHVFVYDAKRMLDRLKKHSNYTVKKAWKWQRQTTPVNTTQRYLWQLELKNANY